MGRSFIPAVPGWIGVAALVLGLAVVVIASALPERWQEAAVYLGVGITFATIGGILINLVMAARPRWRGTAMFMGIIVGALPVLVVAWRNLHSHGDIPALAIQSPQSTALAPIRTRPVAQAQSEPAVGASAAQQLEPVLAEVSDLLNNQARPALSRAVATLMRARARALDTEAVRSQLTSATGELEQVRTSLRRVELRHHEFRGELADVIGDTAVLDDVISALRGLGDSLDGAPADDPLRRPGNEPRNVTAPADRWIADCNQRIEDLRKTLAAAA